MNTFCDCFWKYFERNNWKLTKRKSAQNSGYSTHDLFNRCSTAHFTCIFHHSFSLVTSFKISVYKSHIKYSKTINALISLLTYVKWVYCVNAKKHERNSIQNTPCFVMRHVVWDMIRKIQSEYCLLHVWRVMKVKKCAHLLWQKIIWKQPRIKSKSSSSEYSHRSTY